MLNRTYEIFARTCGSEIDPDRGKLDALATCAFIRQTDNVLFMGPPGVGKSTQHYMHVLKGDAAVPPRRLRSKRYLNSALLVIDEIGFRPLDRQEANLFFRLVSARYEKGSTSNKHVRDWHEIVAGRRGPDDGDPRPPPAPRPSNQPCYTPGGVSTRRNARSLDCPWCRRRCRTTA